MQELIADRTLNYTVTLAENEFLNQDDYVGFLTREPEPQTFLSHESQVFSQERSDGEASLYIKFSLSENKHIYERDVYALFTLIGDVGGFNGAIVILPSFLMAIYSNRMYQSSI